MNNMQKSFKRKSALRCMAEGGAVENSVPGLSADGDRGAGRMRAVGLRAGLRMVAPRLVPGVGLATLGKQLYDETRPGGMLARREGTVKFRPLPIQDASEGAKPARNARRMADGGAVYKSEVNGVPTFSDAPGGALYTPGSPTPAPAPPQTIGPPSSLAPPPLPVPPPAAKISPLAIGPKSDLIAKTGGFGPTPAPMSTYQKAGGTGSIGSMPSRIGVNRPEIGANRVPIGERRPEIGAPRMGALGRPIMTSVGYASGGKVRGPGGPTEDKIPAMLSDGEYVLPADTVKKVGVQNLDALKDATHAPSGQSKLRGNVRKYGQGSPGGVKPMTDNELFQAQEQRRQNPQFYEQLPRPNVIPVTTPKQINSPVEPLARPTAPAGIALKDPAMLAASVQSRLANMSKSAPYDRTGGIMPPPEKLSIAPTRPPTPPMSFSSMADEGGIERMGDKVKLDFTAPVMGDQVRREFDRVSDSSVPFLERAVGAGRMIGAGVLAAGEGTFNALSGPGGNAIRDISNGLGDPSARTTAAPSTAAPGWQMPGTNTPAPGAPAPGGTPALPEGVTQRPDGIYQQGNSFTNIVGADGKPQLLQEERMGPPSPAAEAYLARTPEMQFGPIPSGPGSSLRSGRGGGMRLNMPGASSGINARFDKMVADYTKNANWGLSPSKTARTLAGIEQARTNALNGVMGNDTTRRGQDIDKARTDATNAAGMAQEGLKGQFNLLGETAARNAAAQKAQAERDLEMETGTADRLKALFGEDEGLGAHQAYTANQGLIQSMMTPGADGSINVREQDRMSGALHAVLKAAGKGPNSQIVDIVNIPDNNAEAGPTGSPIFDLTLGDAYEIKFANGEVARVKQSALKDTPDAESFLNQWQRRKAQQAKGAK